MGATNPKHVSESGSPHVLDKDLQSYEAEREMLENRYLGKFVVYHDSEFVGAFDNLDEAGKLAIERFGRGPYLIRQVGGRRVIGAGAAVRLPAK